ncbi:MAG: META domain-containing protein [Aquaticitalea sp.]
MKHLYCIFPFLFIFLVFNCGSTKNTESFPIQKDSNILYDKTWQLEYVSGINTNVEDLFPNKKPELTFDSLGNMVRGNAGCNGYSATFTKNGDEISFSDPGPSTLMYCGDGEPTFLKIMTKINRYSVDGDGKLNLMVDDVPVMRFHKL